MRDLPIIYSAPMIRALLDGRKRMTRRLAWGKRKPVDPTGAFTTDEVSRPSPWQRVQPGDRLWVRENIGRRIAVTLLGTPATNGVEEAFYAADESDVLDPNGFNLCPWWKQQQTLPCIHMPRWASRLTLIVAETKIERLNNMSDEDAVAEGVVERPDGLFEVPGLSLPSGAPIINSRPRDAFACLWDMLHGSGKWLANPEVIFLHFDVHRCNIDALSKREGA